MTQKATPFLYHAWAHAFSGHFTRPIERLIEVQAGVSLPITGGHGSSRVENFRFNETVSFKSGYSQVSGSEKFIDDRCIHTTLATSVVEGLNILDVITADRIVSRVASSWETGSEPESVVIGSRFENLRIAGHEIEVELHHELALQMKTFADARKQFASNSEFRKMAESPFGAWKLPKKIEPQGVIVCSLVKELKPEKCPGIKQHGHHGHVLEIPEFGKVYLAELVQTHGTKTLTMIRFELGSPNGGGGSSGQSGTNGRPPSGG
ncbi:MAG TPA: choice-of-anchor P family protein [Candidatus Saccharimonadales bacterium]|nr:choice-of-anchor P family protein [Candidatus Saccharimonadales bacterium]